MSIADKLNVLISSKEDMKAALQEKNCNPTGGLSTYSDAISNIATNYGLHWGFKNGNTNKPPGWKFQTKYYMPEAQNHIEDDGFIYINRPRQDLNKFVWYGLTNWKLNPNAANRLSELGFVNLRYIPSLNCSEVNTLNSVFSELHHLQYCCDLNCPQLTSMHSIFQNCVKLSRAPSITTSNVTDMSGAYECCYNLCIVPLYDASKTKNTAFMFRDCTRLFELSGFKNLGAQPDLNVGTTSISNMFYGCKRISRGSVLNIFVNLFNRASAGYSNITIRFEHEVIERLRDSDIAIATNKGWIIQDGVN